MFRLAPPGALLAIVHILLKLFCMGLPYKADQNPTGWFLTSQVKLLQSCIFTMPELFFRTYCLTKNYCGKDCLQADQAVHAVCCSNLMDVDRRKWKKGGNAKEENANKVLETFQTSDLDGVDVQTQGTLKTLNEVVSKMKKVKVKKEVKGSEVD